MSLPSPRTRMLRWLMFVAPENHHWCCGEASWSAVMTQKVDSNSNRKAEPSISCVRLAYHNQARLSDVHPQSNSVD